MDERAKWESRYSRAGGPFYGRAPSRFLEAALDLLPAAGLAIDLGAGEGRNAVFLARRGWRVVAVDLAVAGLARAREIAGGGLTPALVAGDLDSASPLRIAPGTVDLALVFNYHDRGAVAAARDWLAPGGALIVQGFAREQLGRPSGGPKCVEHLWRANELLELARGLRVVLYEDRLLADDDGDNPTHRGERWVVRLLARREPL